MDFQQASVYIYGCSGEKIRTGIELFIFYFLPFFLLSFFSGFREHLQRNCMIVFAGANHCVLNEWNDVNYARIFLYYIKNRIDFLLILLYNNVCCGKQWSVRPQFVLSEGRRFIVTRLFVFTATSWTSGQEFQRLRLRMDCHEKNKK